MTHPNAQTNGASLEDCHTNFFSLTELCGIKWRKLVWGEGEDEGGSETGVSAPLDDPVISSYTRCLAGDILCVWRRVAAVPTSSSADIFDQLAPPPPSAPPPLSLRAAKELWIFWYGEEPDLNGLVAPELMSSAGVYGSWETGLSYECRSLLFKALHNLIERCLLSRDFIRLGKWFVQPYNGDEEEVGKSCWHLSFSFAFFVHGDNMVCASVDVRQHPPVRTLTQRRLAKLNKEDAPNTKVILAPFGLDGVLTGETFPTSETATTRLLDAWRHFYPVEASSGAEGAEGSGAVEVIAGGVRMRYPVRYVMLTDMDPPLDKDPDPAAGGHPLSQHLPAKMAETMAERTYRNMMSQTPTSPNTSVAPVTVKMEPMDICGADGSTESKLEWDFVDPIKKTTCSCAKWRGCGAGASAPRRGDRANSQRRPATHAHTHPPFHRRNAHTYDTLTCSSGGMGGLGGMGGCGGTPGGACSPGSCASPATHSDGAAPVPSPSPHHATAHQGQSQSQGQQQQPTTPRGGNPQPTPLLHTPAPTPDPHAPSTPIPAPRTPHTPRTPRNQAMESPSQITVNGVGASCGLVGGCELLKRPVLHAAEREPDPLDDEHTLHMLYDYSTMHAWLDHPVKRFKMESGAGTGAGGGVGCGGLWEDRLTRIAGEDRAPHSHAAPPDLYAGHNHIRMAPVLPNSVYLMRDVKQEPNDDANKEMKNLFTSDGLLPSYKDLDQIFDNSDDPGSGDETLQVHTPPDSNKSGGCLGDDSLLLCGGGGGGRTGHVRPEELTKMFPTPPSLEHHPQPSPGAFTLPDTDLPVHTHHTTAPRAGSPQDEPIEDWSYVFKPPTICKYVGSSKYAPLTNLPSQVLPLVTLPPHCVYRPKFKPTANTAAPTTNGGEVILKQEMKEPRSVPPPSPASMKAGAGLRTPTHANQPHTPSHMLSLHQPLSNLHSVGVISAPSSVGPAPSPLVVGPGPMSRPAPPPYMGGASPPPPRRPDACPLLLNVLLADTVLNIFRDHNFDSCTLCVCNEGPKEVGNIRGADCGVYLAPASVSSTASPGYGSPGSQPNSPLMQAGYEDSDHIKCSCGFSAVINRRLAHRAGLFYEDEMEITGLAEDPSEYKKHKNTEATMNSILELVREQCTGVRSSSNALVRAAREAAEDVSHDEMRVNMLEYTDGGDAAALALEAATAGAAPARCSLPTVHRWPFISARCPRSTQDVMRVLRRIRLLLVDAIQKKCTPVMWNAVDGPLTWRNFLHLAGRGTNDLCEPQPVPPILVGHDRDWLALSPSAIHYWDKLTLEPYSYARDAAYLVVAPDSEPLVENVRTFFRELSTAYEMCRLGRHTPLNRIAREGILRAPRSTVGSSDGAEDEWAGTLPTGAVGEVLRSYAATLRSVLAPALAALQLDRALLEAEARADRRQHGSMQPPPDNTQPTAPNSQTEMDTDNAAYASCQLTVGAGSGVGSLSSLIEGEEDEAGAPMLVVYLVEPSGLAGDPERRAGCLALLRCAAALENMLPEQLRPNVNVKIISMEAVTELSRWRSRIRRGDEMRALAMSVFTQSRRLLQHQPNIKSLTGFGTAASADVFLKSKDEKNRAAYRLYSPAYVLAPTKQARDLANTLQQAAPEPSPVLYLSYCLSADQDWLLAVATDSRGELLETAAINIHVPARARRRKATAARRLGLSKLMEFILGVMSQSAHPWRLVVGRIGRIGHGELRSWSGLLSRSNLLKASRTLRELCGSCSLTYSPGAPWILSACLVSTEPDSSLRIMADCYTPCERFSQAAARSSHLHTPRDVSCTHILVFPTSAKAESSQSVFQEPTNETDFYPDLLSEITDDDVTGILDIDSLFEWPKRTEGASDEEGGGGSGAGSPGRTHRARSRGHSPAERQANGTSREVFQLQQQPLALGYLVSTAPLGAMPAWWWAACPHLAHLAGRCPTFLKNSLHLHCALTSNEDELGAPPTQAPSSNTHQLDSGITTDVLRYVLEGYNALSWLSLDSNTHDRLSCLPLHMQVLMQLYHTATALL